MKNLFKNYFIFSFFAILWVVVACKKDEVLTPAKSSDKSMFSFAFSSLSPAVSATITGTTVAAMVPFNVDVTSLAPTIAVAAKATISPASGSIQNFTNVVTYTVTAEDGTTQAYSVSITKGIAPKSNAKDITKFSFATLSPVVDATIDATNKTISATVPATTDITKLVPTITISDKATISPASGVATDFSKEVSYTVTAEDLSTVVYKITVNKAIVASIKVCRIAGKIGMSSTNGANKDVNYKYDGEKRLISITTRQIKSTGNSISYDDNDINTEYTYDSKGRIILEKIFSSANSAFSFTYEYDVNGNLSKYYNTNSNTIFIMSNGKATGVSQYSDIHQINTQGLLVKATFSNATLTYKYDKDGQLLLYEYLDPFGKRLFTREYEYSTVKYSAAETNKGWPIFVDPVGRTNNIFRVKKYTYKDYSDDTKSYIVTYDYKAESGNKIISHTETILKNNISSVYNYEYGYLECD